jgi:hypothetical protein
MKKSFLVMIALPIVNVAYAQTQVMPNGVDGYNVYSPNGTSQVTPSGVGGCNIYGPTNKGND